MRISDWSSDVCSSDLCETRPCLSLTAAGCCCPRELPGGIAGGITGEELSGKLRRPEAARKGAPPQPAAGAASSMMNCTPSRPFQRSICRRPATWSGRSEEHTSELQSLMRISYAVFCLKKKKKHQQTLGTNKR